MAHMSGRFLWARSRTEDREDLADYRPGGYHPVHLGDVITESRPSNPRQYRIFHKLGYGQFSTVWLAHDMSTAKRCVALKINKAELTGKSKEGAMLRSLAAGPSTHPGYQHITKLLDSFQINGPNGVHEVLVTDPVVPLREFGQGGLLKKHAKKVMSQTTLGLAYMHSEGIVHGDLHFDNLGVSFTDIQNHSVFDIVEKLYAPEYIGVIPRDPLERTPSLPMYVVVPVSIVEYMAPLVRESGMHQLRVQIIDFGNAFHTKDKDRPRPDMPACILPPELLFEGKNEIVTTWCLPADIWSLACTMYEIMFNTVLFSRPSFLACDMVKHVGPLPIKWRGIGLPIEWRGVAGLTRRSNEELWDSAEREWNTFCTEMTVYHPSDDIERFIALIRAMLRFRPKQRPSAEDVLTSLWFRSA